MRGTSCLTLTQFISHKLPNLYHTMVVMHRYYNVLVWLICCTLMQKYRIPYCHKAALPIDLQHYPQWPNTSRDVKRHSYHDIHSRANLWRLSQVSFILILPNPTLLYCGGRNLIEGYFKTWVNKTKTMYTATYQYSQKSQKMCFSIIRWTDPLTTGSPSLTLCSFI